MKTKNLALSITIILALSAALIPGHKSHALTFSPSRFEISGDPGQTIEKEMLLANESNSPQTYYSVFRNFEAEGETGTPRPTDSESGLASWMSAESEVVVPAKSTKEVAFQIRIPASAEPGGYFAMVLWATTPPGDSISNQVSIGAQTGPLVLLTVNGDVRISGAIREYGITGDQNFFLSLPVQFYFKFRNDGSDRIKPIGDIHIKNFLGLGGKSIPANRVEGNILPNGTRKFETEWKRNGEHASSYSNRPNLDDMGFWGKVKHEWHNYAFGRYTATLSLTYGVDNQHASEKVTFWVVPWHLLVTIIVGLILAYLLMKFIIHRYNRFIISQATIAIEHMEEERGEHEHSAHEHPHHANHRPKRRV